MTPCEINGKPTFRLSKTEQRALVTASRLIHSLSFNDQSLASLSTELIAAAARLDEYGVYTPVEERTPLL